LIRFGSDYGSIDMHTGETYTIGFWAQGAGKDAKIGMGGFGGATEQTIPAHSGWTFYQFTFTCDQDFNPSLLNRTSADFTTGDANVRLDGIVLVRGDVTLSGDLVPYTPISSKPAGDLQARND